MDDDVPRPESATTAAESVAAETPLPPRPGPRFTAGTNVFAAVLLGIFLALNYWAVIRGKPGESLWYPGATGLRLADRTLACEANWHRLPLILRWADVLVPQTEAETWAEVRRELEAAEGLAGRDPSDRENGALITAALALLDAESGDLAAAESRWKILEADASSTEIASLMRQAYQTPPRPVPEQAGYEVAKRLPPQWFYYRLQERFALSRGETALASDWRRSMKREFEPRLGKLGLVGGMEFILLVVGLVLSVEMFRNRHTEPAPTRLPDCWSLAEGLGVFLWGLLLVQFAFVIMDAIPFVSGVASALPATTMGLPILLLVWARISRPAGLSLDSLFGLRADKGIGRQAVALWALHSLAWPLMAALCGMAGIIDPPLSNADERMMWSGGVGRGIAMLDSTLGAGFFEEVAYRGVLFLTLRRWCRFSVAAAVSALFFATMHYYPVTGFLTVAVFGFFQAWSVERSQSLLPAIIAHTVFNLFLGLQSLVVFG